MQTRIAGLAYAIYLSLAKDVTKKQISPNVSSREEYFIVIVYNYLT